MRFVIRCNRLQALDGIETVELAQHEAEQFLGTRPLQTHRFPRRLRGVEQPGDDDGQRHGNRAVELVETIAPEEVANEK